jgi:hypothetical protein
VFFYSENYGSLETGIHSVELIWSTKCYIIFNISMLYKWRRLNNFTLHGLSTGDLCLFLLLQLPVKKMMNYEVVIGFNFLIEWRDCIYRRSFTPVGKVINIRYYVLR